MKINFLIQTIDNQIKHDFSFTLLESLNYLNWLHNNNNPFNTIFNNEPIIPNCIPIGSVEFVSTYLTTFHNKTPKPKNIPADLLNLTFTGRNVFNGTIYAIMPLQVIIKYQMSLI